MNLNGNTELTDSSLRSCI